MKKLGREHPASKEIGVRHSAPVYNSPNQLEPNRALRNVQALHDNLKMPAARLPAVLTYLRWLDRMEAWNGRKYPTTINEASARLRDTEQLYSWGSDFGNPIVLPKIKKQPHAEKFSSAQIKDNVFESERRPDKSKQRRSRTATRSLNKPTAFYVHAMNGFKYWPPEVYAPPQPATKYSFGERFNPGRCGVINDRIYARPSTNKHYWTEFQLHQNPIGSGNTVTGPVLKN